MELDWVMGCGLG